MQNFILLFYMQVLKRISYQNTKFEFWKIRICFQLCQTFNENRAMDLANVIIKMFLKNYLGRIRSGQPLAGSI